MNTTAENSGIFIVRQFNVYDYALNNQSTVYVSDSRGCEVAQTIPKSPNTGKVTYQSSDDCFYRLCYCDGKYMGMELNPDANIRGYLPNPSVDNYWGADRENLKTCAIDIECDGKKTTYLGQSLYAWDHARNNVSTSNGSLHCQVYIYGCKLDATNEAIYTRIGSGYHDAWRLFYNRVEMWHCQPDYDEQWNIRYAWSTYLFCGGDLSYYANLSRTDGSYFDVYCNGRPPNDWKIYKRESEGVNSFKIFPNPVGDLLNLSLESSENSVNTEFHVILYDALGKVLVNQKNTEAELKNTLQMNLSSLNLNQGVYFLKVINTINQENTAFTLIKN